MYNIEIQIEGSAREELESWLNYLNSMIGHYDGESQEVRTKLRKTQYLIQNKLKNISPDVEF